MRAKTKEMLKKVKDYLYANEYTTADQIAEFCGLSRMSAYRIIKLLRLSGIGIIPGKKGYILSDIASKQDDVKFVRTCFGRRASDILALSVAEKDIRKRWRSVQDKNNITYAIEHITAEAKNPKNSENGLQYLISSVNEKGS